MNFTEHYDMFLSDEHELLRKTVRDFAEREVAPHIRDWDRSGAETDAGPETREHIRPVLERMGELGLRGAGARRQLPARGNERPHRPELALAVAMGQRGAEAALPRPAGQRRQAG